MYVYTYLLTAPSVYDLVQSDYIYSIVRRGRRGSSDHLVGMKGRERAALGGLEINKSQSNKQEAKNRNRCRNRTPLGLNAVLVGREEDGLEEDDQARRRTLAVQRRVEKKKDRYAGADLA